MHSIIFHHFVHSELEIALCLWPELFFHNIIIKLCTPVMHTTISFTLDIYTTAFIVANYYILNSWWKEVR